MKLKKIYTKVYISIFHAFLYKMKQEAPNLIKHTRNSTKHTKLLTKNCAIWMKIKKKLKFTQLVPIN